MKKLLTLTGMLCLLITGAKAQWTTICSSGNGMVVNMVNYHDTIYATGFFTSVCGETARYIAGWDGTSWHALDTGLYNEGHKLSVIDDQLYVAKYSWAVDSNWVLRWNGAGFDKVGAGVYLSGAATGTLKTPGLYDIVSYRGKMVVSGEFDSVGNQGISGIMQWNGSDWEGLGSGLSGAMGMSGIMYPHQMLVIDTSLYVAGNFTTAGGVTVNGIARWDGYAWHSVGAGFDGIVYALGEVDGVLYAGGEFTMSGSTQLQRVAKWSGSEWVYPGFGVYYTSAGVKPYIHTIKQIGARGVFEGGFDRLITPADTMIAHSVVAVRSGGFDTLAGGIANGEFEGLLPYHDTDVLVGGAIFGLTTSTHIAHYHFEPLSVTGVAGSHIRLYPNPVTDVLHIEGCTSGDIVIITDVTGRRWQAQELTGTSSSVSLKDMPQALLYLRIIQPDGSEKMSQMLIKE